jgi:hypothetical protein
MENYNSICEYLIANKYSTLISFFSTVIGAFLGFFFALIIYWSGNRNVRKNKLKAEKEKAYNTLKRFSLLLESIIKTCRLQNEHFDSHAKDLLEKPLDFHFPQILATNDRERLTESDDIELYYSFMLFDVENDNKFRDYKNIFNHADFLQKHYNDLIIQNEKHQSFLHNDLKIVRDNLLAIVIRVGLIQKDIQFASPNEYLSNHEFQFLERYRNVYFSLKGNGFTNFEPYRDKFLIPFQLELFEKLTNQLHADELASYIATALTRMDNVQVNAIDHAANFSGLNKDENINSALEYFVKINNRINEITSHNST